MSGVGQLPEADALISEATADGAHPAAPTDNAAANAPSADATSTDATPAEVARAPLTSLSTLLGGVGEGGAACAADGTCD